MSPSAELSTSPLYRTTTSTKSFALRDLEDLELDSTGSDSNVKLLSGVMVPAEEAMQFA
ncbi:unknown [Ruminococcus sp. CAG:403]|nr:unknown [Ruminococcus sp. CAG:403]